MTVLQVLAIWIGCVAVLGTILFLGTALFRYMTRSSDSLPTSVLLPTPEAPPVEPSKKVCQLSIKMTDGAVFQYTNGTWDSVARKFYRWYFGRPDSTNFVMHAQDKQGKTTTVFQRKLISLVETRWVLDPPPPKPKGPANIPT